MPILQIPERCDQCEHCPVTKALFSTSENLFGICKMGMTFAYELGLKSFLYEKSSTRKVTYDFNICIW